jgi:hypothetical protein
VESVAVSVVLLVSELVSVVLLESELELPQAARLNAMVSARSVARNFFMLNSSFKIIQGIGQMRPRILSSYKVDLKNSTDFLQFLKKLR